ncbi:MsnO8 family LLM class oxidoreductase [Pseudarthrobacter sp. H3Y2-7]|uniref:MsnO8 family LLM class oxidoreductase n=1 Tax=Pseudarthrobacter naphthalenicus TaxID=3031328 RepID=UPI0023AF43A5|nr:MsnO8 family LLM class oxidoreductase [Pseudarthrobacter sp. H3Y2-7]MDE8668421.1 MsnO8 family LLM class oxidoreductase [Pseudarthrobacter sp. H3Y2-7]
MLSLNVLDQIPVFQGSSPQAAVRESVQLAAAAEDLHFKGFWIAEHHGDSSRACASPAVLLAAVASHTNTMRIGAGCILLPYASPLRVAEDFRMLLALAPARIDLGVGNGMGATAAAREALQGASNSEPVTYAKQIQELTKLLAVKPQIMDPLAVPVVGEEPEIWVMASGMRSALVAAALGLPLSLAHFISGESAWMAAAAYREAFVASKVCSAPRISLAVRVTCADTREEAEVLGNCFWVPASEGLHPTAFLRSTPRFATGYPSKEDVRGHVVTADELHFRTINKHLNIVGDVEEVGNHLEMLARRYQTDEVTVTTTCPDLRARIRMYQLLSEHLGLS